MRYRALSPEGDYLFGPATPWYVNSPQAVAQAIQTRLRLIRGTWFLDDRVGFDLDLILGYGTQVTRDQEVRRVIAETEGVSEITQYSSSVVDREFRVEATVETIYGTITITETL